MTQPPPPPPPPLPHQLPAHPSTCRQRCRRRRHNYNHRRRHQQPCKQLNKTTVIDFMILSLQCYLTYSLFYVFKTCLYYFRKDFYFWVGSIGILSLCYNIRFSLYNRIKKWL